MKDKYIEWVNYMDFQENLMNYFRKNQGRILNNNKSDNITNQVKAIASKRTNKGDFLYDVFISFEESFYIVKHIKPAPLNQLLPLDFSEAFVLRYAGDETSFTKESLVLTEEKIEEDFDFTLSNPDNINMIAFSIMTSFPFMDELSVKIRASLIQVGRNEPCPCNSVKKYKKCCGN